MGRKFGKKNHVKIDPLAYNTILLGEPKIGKTALVKEVCEKLVGEEGYLFLEMNQEGGHEAIEGIIAEEVPSWSHFMEIKDEIVENRTTNDWKDLKVIVIDTYDGLIELAESESIRLSNREYPDAKVKSIDAAWKGYQRGQKKALQLMLDALWEFKSVGISFIVIGHVKSKELSDAVSGSSYVQLTNDVEKLYFNGLKKKAHFLALAYCDRTLVSEKTGKKDNKNKDIIVNKVKEEVRKIKYRDDSFVIDSGSRFADISNESDFTADAFIDTLTDAIKKEQAKSGKSFEETKIEQEKAEAEKLKEIAMAEVEAKKQKIIDVGIGQIIEFIKENMTINKDKVNEIMVEVGKLGYENPTQINNQKDLEKILKLIN